MTFRYKVPELRESRLSCNVVKSLLPCIDSVLGIREQIGAVIRKVCLVTRTWDGKAIGDGSWKDETTEIRPQPGIRDVAHDIRLMEGGDVRQGDLFIIGISKNRYRHKTDLDCSSDCKTVEKFYKVGDDLYECIYVKEKHVTWTIQVRRLSSQGDPA